MFCNLPRLTDKEEIWSNLVSFDVTALIRYWNNDCAIWLYSLHNVMKFNIHVFCNKLQAFLVMHYIHHILYILTD